MEDTFFLKAEFNTESILAHASKIMELANELEKEAHYLRFRAMDIKSSETSCEKDVSE